MVPTAGPNDWSRGKSIASTVNRTPDYWSRGKYIASTVNRTPDSPARSLVTAQIALSVPETLQFLESG